MGASWGHLMTHADAFVILGRRCAAEAKVRATSVVTRLGVTLSEVGVFLREACRGGFELLAFGTGIAAVLIVCAWQAIEKWTTAVMRALGDALTALPDRCEERFDRLASGLGAIA